MRSTLRGCVAVLALSACTSPTAITAEDVATAARYPSLLFEVDAQVDAPPSTDALDDVVGELEALVARGALGKPDGVEVRVDQILTASTEPDHAWTTSKLAALADEYRSIEPRAGQLVVHVAYVDGHYAGDSETDRALGLAIGHDRIVLFRSSIDTGCAGVPARWRTRACALTEANVLLHEVGHAMGLVADGLPMATAHQDTEHGAHDVDERCLMHYAADRSGFIALLADRAREGEAAPTPFCDACLADLTAAQSPPTP